MPAGQGDYYTFLGVRRDASIAAIKRAYHTAARRFHPDKNLMPGETELFLEVQRAYEVLSDPQRRSLYDATLPDGETGAAPFAYVVSYSRQNLAPLDEPQLIYALLEAEPSDSEADIADVPLNLCLVLDRSTSMAGQKMDLVKAAAIRIVQMLRPQDRFSLVVFGDRADVLLSSTLRRDGNQSQSRIQAIQPRGATEILRGLEAGLTELRRGLDLGHGNHLILLTDGHTYGDEPACLRLADEAARLNISISGFGVGNDWNDVFLDELVGRTGGNSTYISHPQEIEHVLVEKFRTISQILIDNVTLQTQVTPGVNLSYAFRTQPEGGPIELQAGLHLGPVVQDIPLRVLFEFSIEPSASSKKEVTLLDGILHAEVRNRPTPWAPTALRMQLPVTGTMAEQPPPASIMGALSTLALYRLQERARQEAKAGEYEAATRHLRNLALQLEVQGKHQLSKTAMLEAQNLERIKALSEEGGKVIKYGTRALLLPPPESPV
jgi:Ca-activated chloride channel family protein